MAHITGFWSYVHADDEAEGGRIAQLSKDVAAQFELLTGEPIELFLDIDSIRWGDNWRDEIDNVIATGAFFIAVMTPRYFRSPECRRELQLFARRATQLGAPELVLPLLYVEVPGLRDEEPVDDLMALAKTFVWEDWTDLGLSEPQSEAYRRGVRKLAMRLVDANAQAERSNLAEAAAELEEAEAGGPDDAPGVLDRLAEAETTMPGWTHTIEAIGREIEHIGQIMQQATRDIEKGDTQGKGFAARLSIARRVAQELTEPAQRIVSFGSEFAAQLQTVDAGFRTIIPRLGIEVNDGITPKERACEFFGMIQNLTASVHEGMSGVQGMVDAIGPIESMSSDLRPPLRQLRQGLTVMTAAREVADSWVDLVARTGIDCGSDGG